MPFAGFGVEPQAGPGGSPAKRMEKTKKPEFPSGCLHPQWKRHAPCSAKGQPITSVHDQQAAARTASCFVRAAALVRCSFDHVRNLPFPTRANFVACSETHIFSFPFLLFRYAALGCRPDLRRGFTPAPDKGQRPLTLFRWRVPLGGVVYCSSSRAMVRARMFQLMKPPFITGLPSKGL